MTLQALDRMRIDTGTDPDIPLAPPETPSERAEPSTRYSDQTMSVGTRLFGLSGTSAIALLILGAAFFTWRTYTAPKTPATLSVFDVAPPAAPPEPPREVPPDRAPEQQEKPLPVPEAPNIDPPEIRLRSDNPLSIPPPQTQPQRDPAPPVEKTAAPETKPIPPAPQVSAGKQTWEGLVLGALNKVKRYPRDAYFARQQGVPYIRFVIDRQGKVVSARIERSSGNPSLDREALALPKRAQPLPAPPDDIQGGTIELVVPVEFFISARR